jgi:hypothetical protein
MRLEEEEQQGQGKTEEGDVKESATGYICTKLPTKFGQASTHVSSDVDLNSDGAFGEVDHFGRPRSPNPSGVEVEVVEDDEAPILAPFHLEGHGKLGDDGTRKPDSPAAYLSMDIKKNNGIR